MEAPSELQIIAQAQAGDAAALNGLITRHTPFVRMVIKRIVGPILVEEYLTIGMMALARAIKKYDPAFNCKLLTPAKIAIFRDVKRAYRISGLVRIPTSPIKEKYRTQAEATYRIASSDARYDGGLLKFHLQAAPEPEQDDPVLRARMHDAISQIQPRLQELIHLRMRGQTLEQVGVAMNLTRERVRQLQGVAYVKLAEILEPSKVQPPKPKRPQHKWGPDEDSKLDAAAAQILVNKTSIGSSVMSLEAEIHRTPASIAYRLRQRVHALEKEAFIT